jgi:diaminopimelate decarboxylase
MNARQLSLPARAKVWARTQVQRFARAVALPSGLPLSLWNLTRDAEGRLELRGSALEGLLARFGSPLHVVDVAQLEENAARFMFKPEGASQACDVFYSYKTNPVPGVLQLLHRQGVGAEATSPYELWLALRLGVEPESIIYNEPAKSEASMREAIGIGAGLINLNARQEIAPFAAMARQLRRRPRIGIRVAVPQGVSGQFGERIDDGSALKAFTLAMQHPELEVVAVHAHLNGSLATRAHLEAFLDALLAFTDTLHARLGLTLEIIDLGGNLCCPTVTHRSFLARRFALATGVDVPLEGHSGALTIDEYVREVCTRVDAHFAMAKRQRPRVLLEPGRSMTASTQALLCRVAQLRDPDASGISTAVLDAGINIAEALRNERHQIFALRQRAGRPRSLYRLAGPTCTLGDVMAPGCELSALEPGDALAIMDCGAYCVPYSTCFSFPRPGVVALRSGVATVLRRAETFDDLIALDSDSEEAPAGTDAQHEPRDYDAVAARSVLRG